MVESRSVVLLPIEILKNNEMLWRVPIHSVRSGDLTAQGSAGLVRYRFSNTGYVN